MEGITRWLRSVHLNVTHFTVRSGVKMAQDVEGQEQPDARLSHDGQQ
jgi:hypothetical protein